MTDAIDTTQSTADVTAAGQFTQEDIDAAVATATGGIRADLTRTRKAGQDVTKQLEETQKSLTDIQESIAAEKAAKEKDSLESEGKYQEALGKAKSDYDIKIGEKDTVIEKLDSSIRKLLVDNAIMAAAGDSVNPEQIVTLMTSTGMFKVIDKDGNYTVEVFDKDGLPMVDEDIKPATVEYAVKMFITANPHLAKATTQGGTGSQQTQTTAGLTEIQKLEKQLTDLTDTRSPVNSAQRNAIRTRIHELQQTSG